MDLSFQYPITRILPLRYAPNPRDSIANEFLAGRSEQNHPMLG